jgi:hypothetical protein
MLQVIACNTRLQKGEMDRKRSYGVLASVLVRSNARSKIERTPRRPVSRAVALAGPNFHRIQPCAVAVMCVQTQGA